jgi:nucleoside 2-deoxyribosyltransferase
LSKQSNQKIAFIAAPFTTRFDPRNGVFDNDLKRTLERIMKALRMKGYQVKSSHIREDWGNNIMKPPDFVPRDHESIEESDIVLAYIDDCSTGLYIELGWASNLKKNIIILLKADVRHSPMLHGLHNICKTHIFEFQNTEELLLELDKQLDRALQS